VSVQKIKLCNIINLESAKWFFSKTIPLPFLLHLKHCLYGTRRFITVFTRAHHWSLSWARWIHCTSSHPISLRFVLILSSFPRLGLPSGLFRSFDQNYVCFYHLLVCHMPCPSRPSWLDRSSNNSSSSWWRVQIMECRMQFLPCVDSVL
jgi:hypothetical protein